MSVERCVLLFSLPVAVLDERKVADGTPLGILAAPAHQTAFLLMRSSQVTQSLWVRPASLNCALARGVNPVTQV